MGYVVNAGFQAPYFELLFWTSQLNCSEGHSYSKSTAQGLDKNSHLSPSKFAYFVALNPKFKVCNRFKIYFVCITIMNRKV